MTLTRIAREVADKGEVEVATDSDDSESDNEEIVVAVTGTDRKSGDVNLDDEFEKIVPFKFKRLSEESIDEVDHEIEQILSDAAPLEIALATKEENHPQEADKKVEKILQEIDKKINLSKENNIDKTVKENLKEIDEDSLRFADEKVEESLQDVASFSKLENLETKIDDNLKVANEKIQESLQKIAHSSKVEILEFVKKVEDNLKVADEKIEEILHEAADLSKLENLEADKKVEDNLKVADEKIKEVLQEAAHFHEVENLEVDNLKVASEKIEENRFKTAQSCKVEILKQPEIKLEEKVDDNLKVTEISAPDDHKSPSTDLEPKRIAKSDQTEPIEANIKATPIINDAKSIIDESLLPTDEASSHENSDEKPPVPIQTYLWEDLKRAKEQVSGDNVCTSICSVTFSVTQTHSTVFSSIHCYINCRPLFNRFFRRADIRGLIFTSSRLEPTKK